MKMKTDFVIVKVNVNDMTWIEIYKMQGDYVKNIQLTRHCFKP